MDEQLAGGKLLLDSPGRGGRPAPHLQPRAPQRARPRDPRRAGRDAAAARPRDRDPLRADHRRAAGLLRRLRHRRDPRRDLRARRRGARRPPLPRRDGGDRRPPLADRRGDQRPLPRRRPRAGDHLRPADLRRRRQAGHAAGQARPDLRPHRPAQVPRHDRPGPDQGAVPDRPQLRRRRGPSRSASSTKSSATSELEADGGRAGRRDRRQRAALDARQQAARSTCSTPTRCSASSRRPAWSPCASPASPPRTSARASAPSPRSASREWTGTVSAEGARSARRLRPDDGGADRADRRDRPGDAAATAQRGAARRRLRRAAAGDRRPAALDQSGADDLPAGARPLRRHHALARAAAGGRARPTCAAPASPAARSSTSATSPPTCSSGELELDRLDELADEEAIEEIVAVRGLGQLDRGDVPALPPRTARRPLRRRPRHPQGGPDRVRAGGDADARSEVLEIGEPWRPHRSLASLYLWESLAARPVPSQGTRPMRPGRQYDHAPALLARLRRSRRDRRRLGRGRR